MSIYDTYLQSVSHLGNVEQKLAGELAKAQKLHDDGLEKLKTEAPRRQRQLSDAEQLVERTLGEGSDVLRTIDKDGLLPKKRRPDRNVPSGLDARTAQETMTSALRVLTDSVAEFAKHQKEQAARASERDRELARQRREQEAAEAERRRREAAEREAAERRRALIIRAVATSILIVVALALLLLL